MAEAFGAQQAAMGAAGFENRAGTPPVFSPVEPAPPGVLVNLLDIGQQQEQMGEMGRLAQPKTEAEAVTP
ncbi:hypothetical protein A3E73_01080 [Candidatus Beckwithbacteria bacterium RIFCSPHIGHO2_12_FULL_47_17]|uniref:Uncharacterized protein n=1 Tax=Candidatus Beckwithbacteria bacterium RIFCSPHIGHO2_12_FULL_47_17 TaxID=1797460 RepID=A0A1F5DJS7_9BACT|nr:MAG: hypothetical protein A3E73_01080 [Candidatus Beckwithbacteria bacterium RIFCSPHIGHO2_12_FULL_47_17]